MAQRGLGLLALYVLLAASDVLSQAPSYLAVQTGRSLRKFNSSTSAWDAPFTYNATFDCSPNTQYSDTWNYGNGAWRWLVHFRTCMHAV